MEQSSKQIKISEETSQVIDQDFAFYQRTCINGVWTPEDVYAAIHISQSVGDLGPLLTNIMISCLDLDRYVTQIIQHNKVLETAKFPLLQGLRNSVCTYYKEKPHLFRVNFFEYFNIPDEILINIFKFLEPTPERAKPSKKPRKVFELTCKRWYSLSRTEELTTARMQHKLCHDDHRQKEALAYVVLGELVTGSAKKVTIEINDYVDHMCDHPSTCSGDENYTVCKTLDGSIVFTYNAEEDAYHISYEGEMIIDVMTSMCSAEKRLRTLDGVVDIFAAGLNMGETVEVDWADTSKMSDLCKPLFSLYEDEEEEDEKGIRYRNTSDLDIFVDSLLTEEGYLDQIVKMYANL